MLYLGCFNRIEILISCSQYILPCHTFTINTFLQNISVNMKWCINVNYYSGVLLTAVCANDRLQPIIIADGGRYDDVLLSFR